MSSSQHTPRRPRALVVAVVGLVAASAAAATGCGGVCHNVISAQREVRDRAPGPPDGLPHAQLRLPHNRLNAILDRALEAEPISYDVPIAVGVPLPLAAARAAKIEVVPGRDGTIGFNVEVELELAGVVVTTFGATIEAAPRTTEESGVTFLDVSFDADSLRSVRPQFPENAVKASSGLIGQAVAKATGQKVPGLLLDSLTRRFMKALSGEAFEIIRDNLLVKVGEVTRLRVDLGRAPIERVDVRSSAVGQPTLVINVFTRLPIKHGLPAYTGVDPISGTGLLRVSGETLAELGNWAIAERIAPQTYDNQMRPDPNGAYVPVYAWRNTDMPLVVHAYRIERPCSTVTVGARPEVRVENGEVVMSIEDGRVESVSGSRLMRLGVGLKSLLSGDITKSAAGASSARFEVGGRPLEASVLEAGVAGNELRFTVDLKI